jgi:regulator of sigma E protease
MAPRISRYNKDVSYSIPLAILALGLLIIVHEGGHYLVARWSKMRVEKFSIGFGPGIIKWRRGETVFQIAPIPFGGFVHITGMNPHEEYEEGDPHVYPNRPTWQRFLTILAGPMTNIIVSVFLIVAVNLAVGPETGSGRFFVDGTSTGEPADGILQHGDEVVAVDGQSVAKVGLHDLIQAKNGGAVDLTVIRAGQEQHFTLTPVKKDEKLGYMLGIKLSYSAIRERVGVGESVGLSLRYPVDKSKLILGGFWDIITGKAKPEAHSAIWMTDTIAQTIQHGWADAFELLALLNVYLGLFNLLPLPALDGGRLVFLGYELITRRRPNPRVEAAVHMAGFVVLFFLMILVTLKDIRHL